MTRSLKTLALGLTLCLVAADAFAAASAERTAYRSAKRRGYTAEQTACFVPIFVSYASLDRRGRWVAGGKRKSDVYRHEVYSRCGVIR